MLIPSTITARRTRRYTSTLYINSTIHRVVYDFMDGGGRSDLQPPNVSDYPPAWDTLAPPFTGPPWLLFTTPSGTGRAQPFMCI